MPGIWMHQGRQHANGRRLTGPFGPQPEDHLPAPASRYPMLPPLSARRLGRHHRSPRILPWPFVRHRACHPLHPGRLRSLDEHHVTGLSHTPSAHGSLHQVPRTSSTRSVGHPGFSSRARRVPSLVAHGDYTIETQLRSMASNSFVLASRGRSEFRHGPKHCDRLRRIRLCGAAVASASRALIAAAGDELYVSSMTRDLFSPGLHCIRPGAERKSGGTHGLRERDPDCLRDAKGRERCVTAVRPDRALDPEGAAPVRRTPRRGGCSP